MVHGGEIFRAITLSMTKICDAAETKRPPGNGTAFSFKGE